MKPPLRPLAAEPTSWASISTTSRDGIALLGDDRRPQPGVAAADDAQVAGLGAHQRRVAVGLVGVVVPVRVRVGVGDRVEMEFVDRVVVVRLFDRHWSHHLSARDVTARYATVADMILHVVAFKWKQGIPDGHVETVKAQLLEFAGSLPEVRSYRCGADEGASDIPNFDFAIVAEFDTIDDWNVYDKHPRHRPRSAPASCALDRQRRPGPVRELAVVARPAPPTCNVVGSDIVWRRRDREATRSRS